MNNQSCDPAVYRKTKDIYAAETAKVQYLLDNLLEKLDFAMTIPILIENFYPTVSQHLTKFEMKLLNKIFTKYSEDTKKWLYRSPEERSDCLSLRSRELEKYFNDYVPVDKTIPKGDEYDISKMIQTLYEKPALRSLGNSYKHNISGGAKAFLENIKYFFQISLEEIKTTPDENSMKEGHLRKIFSRFSDLSDYNNFAQETNESQFNKDVSYFDQRIKELRAWEVDIENMKDDSAAYVDALQTETDRILMSEWKAAEMKQNKIISQKEAALTNLDALRKRNIDKEREIRIKRYKTEQQFLNVLKLYDRDLLDRQTLLDSKKASLEEEKALLNEFQVKFDEQTEVYDALAREKAEYEENLKTARLHEIKCKIAARKIQKFYRRYLTMSLAAKSERRSLVRRTRKSNR